MKEEILDVEALLSCADAKLAMPVPDGEGARAQIDEAREKLLAMAEALETLPRN